MLQTEPSFTNEFKEVYLWSEFSAKFGIDSQDIGIDIMALSHDDRWASVQCKAYDSAHTLAQSDLRNFLGINNITRFTKQSSEHFADIYQKLIFHTCKNTSENVYKAIEQAKTHTSQAKIYGFYDLERLNIAWDSLQIEDLSTLQTNAKKELRDYQKDALKAITQSIARGENRAKVIMACGTGKSLLSIRTIDSIVAQNQIALFFAPSLALINQMLLEFFRESISESYKLIAVCSDSKVGSNIKDSKENEDIDSKDTIIPVISNAQHLAAQVSAYQSKSKVIIFSTYQSIDIVIEAQKIFDKDFSLIICDEAHRTAGAQKLDIEGNKKAISVWQKVHYDENLRAKFRLYMTATPRIYSEKAREKLKDEAQGDDLMLFSMDDKAIFGDEIYKLNFDKAISLGILSDYRVLISFISEYEIHRALDRAKENPNLTFDEAGKMISFTKALKKEHIYFIDENGALEHNAIDKEPMRRAVCFHSSIKNSKFVTNNFKKVSTDIAPYHIDGGDNASVKYAKLQWLKEIDENHSCKILNNAKCLTEGIDVPSLDAVAFFDPRDSVVDTVQAVGRAIRKSEGKKYGYIILPIVLSDEEIKEYDKTIKSTKFKGIWRVLKALRSHDERLIDEARISEVVHLSTSSDLKDLPEAMLFPLEELFSGMKNAIPKHLGDLQYWELYASKVGDIMHTLIARISHLIDSRNDIKDLFSAFCKALQANLNASFDLHEAITLIAQHIITKPIFSHIFPQLDFAKFDKVSSELDKLYSELDLLGLSAETKDLERFYQSVQKNAEFAKSDKAKQDLIRNLYDSLFKSAFKKTQEKLGIVYTPIEVVDFIIHSVQYALKKHFDKSLGDKNIHIYDPFTGTRTFITRLIQSGLINSNLAHKYENEIWANEITLLGYYIAQLNITATYHKQITLCRHTDTISCHTERSEVSKTRESKSQNKSMNDKRINKLDSHLQHCDSSDFALSDLDSSRYRAQNDENYKLLDNLLFTDTFNTYSHDSKGFKGQGDLSEQIKYLAHNHAKIEQLKQTDFKDIFGNPPYSTGQNSANDDNKNQKYEALEKRIADTYAKLSKATNKGSNYDSYKMAIRYASDRIEQEGIVAFVTNGSFIEGNADSGLRACLESEFDYIYIFNLRGNQRTSGETSRKEGGKSFDSGSRTPVAISILVKCDKTLANGDSVQSSPSFANGDSFESSPSFANGDFFQTSPSLAEGDTGGGHKNAQDSTNAKILNNKSTHTQTPSAREGALNPKKAQIYYYDIGDYLDRQSKLNIIQNFKSIEGIENAGKFTLLKPNKDYDWINQRDYGYLEFMSIGDKKGKFKPLSPKDEINIFEAFSMGISTSRDSWVFNFSREKLESNMRFMIDNYNKEVDNLEKDSSYKPTMDKSKINWSRALSNDFNKKLKFDFSDNGLIVSSHYRPFTKCHLYLAKHFNEMLYQMPQIYPTPQTTDINVIFDSSNFCHTEQSEGEVSKNSICHTDTLSCHTERSEVSLNNNNRDFSLNTQNDKDLDSSVASLPQNDKNIDCHEFAKANSRNDDKDNDKELAYIKDFYKHNKYLPNLVICLNDGVGNFGALITDSIADNHLFPQTQAFPLYYYEKIEAKKDEKNLFRDTPPQTPPARGGAYSSDSANSPSLENADSAQSSPSLAEGDTGGGYDSTKATKDSTLPLTPSAREGEQEKSTYRRKDAIRDEALNEIRRIYKDSSINKENIFYYIYALLNHKGYKEKYKDNLSKMLPRIPFVKDFWAFEDLGRKLAHLHLNYENFSDDSRAIAIPKAQISTFAGIFGAESNARKNAKIAMDSLNESDFRLKKMAFEKKGKKDVIIFNDKIAVVNIPLKAYNYVVNGKSAVEWIMERYQVKVDKDSGIENNPNLYEATSGVLAGLKGGKYALALLLSVIEISAQSVEIIEQISALDLQEVR